MAFIGDNADFVGPRADVGSGFRAIWLRHRGSRSWRASLGVGDFLQPTTVRGVSRTVSHAAHPECLLF
jgi:hypothetical protein